MKIVLDVDQREVLAKMVITLTNDWPSKVYGTAVAKKFATDGAVDLTEPEVNDLLNGMYQTILMLAEKAGVSTDTTDTSYVDALVSADVEVIMSAIHAALRGY